MVDEVVKTEKRLVEKKLLPIEEVDVQLIAEESQLRSDRQAVLNRLSGDLGGSMALSPAELVKEQRKQRRELRRIDARLEEIPGARKALEVKGNPLREMLARFARQRAINAHNARCIEFYGKVKKYNSLAIDVIRAADAVLVGYHECALPGILQSGDQIGIFKNPVGSSGWLPKKLGGDRPGVEVRSIPLIHNAIYEEALISDGE